MKIKLREVITIRPMLKGILRGVSMALNRIMEMSESLQNTGENKYMLNVSDH